MRDRRATTLPFLSLLVLLSDLVHCKAFEISQSGTSSASTNPLSSLSSSLSQVGAAYYPAGNSTNYMRSGTGISSHDNVVTTSKPTPTYTNIYTPTSISVLGFVSTPLTVSSSRSNSASALVPTSSRTSNPSTSLTSPSTSGSILSTSSFPTLSGPFGSHFGYHGSDSTRAPPGPLKGSGAAGRFPPGGTGTIAHSRAGEGPSSVARVGAGFPTATRTASIFHFGGTHPGSGTVKGASTGVVSPHLTNFPQLTGFSKGSRISGSSFGSVSGIAGGYGPSGSGASGSLGGWARNPACTASWNSRFSAANGTVMTTVTYSYTMTLTEKAVSTFRLGEVATGPTTAVFNAGTVTYEVGSNDQCCGDCNILYPTVRVYFWPTNNTNTWCLQDQTTVPAEPTSSQSDQILGSGLPNLSKLIDLPSMPSTSLAGQRTGAGSEYSGVPPGGFLPEPPEMKPRNEKHPMITAAPKLRRSSAISAHQIEPREYLPLAGLKGLPKLNDTEPLMFDGTHSNFTLGSSNSSHSKVLHKEVIDVVDGMTFVSPTVYVVISTISAKNRCGLVGDIHTSLTLPYAKGQLSTVDALGVTSSFDFADLPCPPSSWAFPNPLQGNSAALHDLASGYRPRILVPHTALQSLDQAWQSCNIVDVGQGYDPPRQLVPQTVMASSTLSSANTMCSDGSLADPDSVYAENTKSLCLEALTGPIGHFPVKEPVFKTPEPALGSGENAEQAGPGYKTPAMAPLAQVTPHLLNAPEPQLQTLETPAAQAFVTQPAPHQPQSNAPPQVNPAAQTVQPIQSAVSNQDLKQAVAAPPPPAVVVGGQTISQGASPVDVKGQLVALSGGNIVVGSSTAPAPVQEPAPTDSTAPIVAGGITLTPASTNVPNLPQPSPVDIGGLTFSAPQVKAQAPSSPQPLNPVSVLPVVAGGITYQPIAQPPTQTPVTVGDLTFNPVLQSENNPKKEETPAIGVPGNTGAANIVVGGQTYISGVTATPADKPIVENGVKLAPVSAGAPASTPLGVVGGQAVLGSSSQAVVAGQTVSAGGPPVTVQGTPVSLGSSEIAIGSSTAPLPPPSPSNEPSALGVVGGQVINGNSQSAIVEGQTISAGGPPATIQGTPVSLGSTNIVIGSSTVALPSSNTWSGNPTNAPLGIVAGQIITGDKSQAVVDGNTILPGSAAIIRGTPVSLGSANIVIGADSIPLPTNVVGGIQSARPSALAIDGATVSNGGEPITVSGTRISLGPSGLVVGSSTVPLTNPAQLSQATGNPAVYSIDGIGVTQGSPPITVSGTRISLGSSHVVIGSNTIALPSSSVFSIGGQVFTPEAGGFPIDGTTITPGGPGVTVSGTPISIDISSDLIFGSSTFALRAGPSGSPTLAVAGYTLTALPKSLGGGFVVDGQTITPGATPKSIYGTAISLNTDSSLIVGSSTIALASAGPGDFHQGSSSPLNADGETFTPLGASSVLIDGTTLSISGAAITDHGTIVSLASDGLVVDSSTFAYATLASNTLTPLYNGPLSGQGPNPTVFAIDGETFTAEPSGLAISGTDISIEGSPITLSGTVISLANDSLVVGASTIPLVNVSGLTAAIDSATATALPTTGSSPSLPGPAGVGPTKKGKGAETGAAGRLEITNLRDCKVLLGLGMLSAVIAWLPLM